MFGGAATRPPDIAELREEASVEHAAHASARRSSSRSSTVSASGAAGQHGIDAISLQVRGGEILGVGGVDGNGQQALAQVIAGQQRLEAGDVRVEGRSVET